MGLPNLAIVAGSGDLPKQLADHCQTTGRGYQIVRFNGIALDWANVHPIIDAEFEKPKSLFRLLAKTECTQVVFAGGMQRPKLNPLKFDLKLMKLAPTLLPALKGGDDSALSLIAQIFEAEGIDVVPAHAILDGLLAQAGAMTARIPKDDEKADIKRALQILNAMSQADVGQACVVAQGLCLGIETIQGSDILLGFVGATKDQFLTIQDGSKGVFVKASKRGQDRRLDMPTIGIDTLTAVNNAGLSGIAVAADGVQILDRDACIKLANELGLFIAVVENE
jgi:DUF1009 family protein